MRVYIICSIDISTMQSLSLDTRLRRCCSHCLEDLKMMQEVKSFLLSDCMLRIHSTAEFSVHPSRHYLRHFLHWQNLGMTKLFNQLLLLKKMNLHLFPLYLYSNSAILRCYSMECRTLTLKETYNFLYLFPFNDSFSQ